MRWNCYSGVLTSLRDETSGAPREEKSKEKFAANETFVTTKLSRNYTTLDIDEYYRLERGDVGSHCQHSQIE